MPDLTQPRDLCDELERLLDRVRASSGEEALKAAIVFRDRLYEEHAALLAASRQLLAIRAHCLKHNHSGVSPGYQQACGDVLRLIQTNE